MNKRLNFWRYLLVCGLSAAAMCAQAGVVLVWQIETGSQTATNTIRVQGPLFRVDSSPSVTMLADLESGNEYLIAHEAKCYVRTPLTNGFQQSPCGDLPGPKETTGRTQTIQGYVVEEYRVTSSCGERAWWVARDYPDWQKLQQGTLHVAAKLSGSPVVTNIFKGMIVRMETLAKTLMSNGTALFQTNVFTLVSAAVVPDDPVAMKIPADYREVHAYSTNGPGTNERAARFLAENDAQAREKSSSNRLATLRPFMQDFKPVHDKFSAAAAGTGSTTNAGASVPRPTGEPQTLAIRSWGADGREVQRNVAGTNGVTASWAGRAMRTNNAGSNQNIMFQAIKGPSGVRRLEITNAPSVKAAPRDAAQQEKQ